MTLVKILWIIVGIVWGFNLIMSIRTRRKAKKAAAEARRVTVEQDAAPAGDEAACSDR